VPELERALKAWTESQPHQWRAMVAQLGIAFEPYARQAFSWIIDNKGAIISGLQSAGSALGSIVGIAGSVSGALGATGTMLTLLAMRVSPLLGLFVGLAAWIDNLMGNKKEKEEVEAAAGGGIIGKVVATAANITGGKRALERAKAASEGGWGTALGAGVANLAEGLGQGVAEGVDRLSGGRRVRGRNYSADRPWYEWISQAFDVSEYLPRGGSATARPGRGYGRGAAGEQAAPVVNVQPPVIKVEIAKNVDAGARVRQEGRTAYTVTSAGGSR
jgi:hypothetical protein